MCAGDYSRTRYPRDLSPHKKEDLRLRVNERERDRMHDINGAMDALRQVMPYGNGPSVKKLSKMSTLLLARNYILTLTKNMEQLKLCVAQVYTEQRKPIPVVASAGPISPLSSGSLGIMGTSLDLPTSPVPCSPLSSAGVGISMDVPMCELIPCTHLSPVTERGAIYWNNAPQINPVVSPRPSTRPIHPHNLESKADDYIENKHSLLHVQHAKYNVLSRTQDSSDSLSHGQYPDDKSEITSPKRLKMKCKSRYGKPCFCVECLTKK